MKEKVLGFKEKDANVKEYPIGNLYWIKQEFLVPVVSLEWLEKYCQEHETLRDCVDRDTLIKAAKKQASEK